jgi:DNA-binding transcriptional MerR regulator
MGKWTKEELTCPECGWVAKNPNGLRGHRQFKHGVRASGAQLPLQEQDRLVTESVLEQRIDEALGEVIEQVGSEVAAIKQQLKQRAEQPLEQANSALAKKVGVLEQQVSELGQRFVVVQQQSSRQQQQISSLAYAVEEGQKRVVEHQGAEELPEPPYLHIIDHKAPGYFPWTEGKWAKIVEA